MTVSNGAGSFVHGQISHEKKLRGGGSLRKFTSARVVDLSALAMLASITGSHCVAFSAGSATEQ